jgi:hypothetical protein
MEYFDKDWSQYLSINLDVATSFTFESGKGKFEWHCKDGIIPNLQKVNDEFKIYRGLG